MCSRFGETRRRSGVGICWPVDFSTPVYPVDIFCFISHCLAAACFRLIPFQGKFNVLCIGNRSADRGTKFSGLLHGPSVPGLLRLPIFNPIGFWISKWGSDTRNTWNPEISRWARLSTGYFQFLTTHNRINITAEFIELTYIGKVSLSVLWKTFFPSIIAYYSAVLTLKKFCRWRIDLIPLD